MTPCYVRHETAPGVHTDIPHEHERHDMSICKVCGGIGYHETWCTRPTDPIGTEKAVVTECAIAELAAEWHKQDGRCALVVEGYSFTNDRDALSSEYAEIDNLRTLHRFATLPHYDDPTETGTQA